MLVLLPPSEGKTAGGSGPPLGRRLGLSLPALAPGRRALVGALRAAAERDPVALATGLRLPPGLAAAALAADRCVTRAPTVPALDRYTGTVYAALDVATLSAAARHRAETGLLVFSGLWGVLRGGDAVPDLRSSDYRAMWRPAGPVSFHAKTVKGLVARHLVAGRPRYRDPMAAVTAVADALDLRVRDTSTRAGSSVDVIGRYTPGVVPSAE